MPTTFDLFYLGVGPEFDTVEGNYTSENHNALNGLSFGSGSDPLALQVQTLSPDPVQGPVTDGDAGAYAANNNAVNERFVIDGGAPRTFDALMVYANTELTYTDGTTATVEAIVMQDTDGGLYLIPSSSGPTAYTDALEAKPIEAVTLGTAQPAGGTGVYGMYADRFQLSLRDGVVEGTSGDDVIDADYLDDPEGDRVDNADNAQGNDDDVIHAGAGNDTIFAGAGNDTVTGGAGDDVISGGDGDDVIYGDGPSDPGLWAYEVWNHDFTSASGQAFDAESGTLAGTGTTQGFDSTQLVNDARGSGGDPSDFGVVYTSTLQPTQSGVYTFATTSDDGSTIRILDADGTPLTWTNQDGSTASYMNNDYHQAATTRSGEVTLEEGVSYTIEVRHWENAGQQVISGTVTSPGGLTEDLADSAMILGPDAAAGNDVIDGGAGDDVIWGGAGDDQITGGTGADQLFGEAGDDTITLGAGDTASGGAGDDLFSLDPATALGGPGATIVIDGDEDGETDGDTLDFSGLIDWGSITYTDPETGSASLADGTTVSFSNIENIIICFTRGTLIETPFGPRPIEDLRPGDFVLTRDHGPQPLRWVGASEVAGEDNLAPIRFARGAFGNDRPLLVSPQHRMLYAGSDAVLYFDTSEVMVPAKHLVNGTSITVVEMARVRYYHMLFDRHEVVWANGAPCESFHPGMEGLAAIDGPAREELFRLFPELRSNPGGYGKTARTVLRGYEARLIEVA